MTVIHLPADLAERLEAAAAANGEDMNNYAVAKLEQVLDTEDTEDTEGIQETDDDLIAALREGIADRDAGNLRMIEQVEQSVHAALAARHRRVAA